jgi:hypothetical protein
MALTFGVLESLEYVLLSVQAVLFLSKGSLFFLYAYASRSNLAFHFCAGAFYVGRRIWS